MQLHRLPELEPTVKEDISQQMFQELIGMRGWRCYSSKHYPEKVETLADTYMNLHATGYLLDDETPVLVEDPPVVIGWRDELRPWIKTKGGIYANGAVTVQDNTDVGTRGILLFVSDETAIKYGYPEEGYLYLYESILEATVEVIKREIKDEAGTDEYE